MARIIVFISFLVGLVFVLNMKDFQSIKVENKKFDFEKKKKSNEEKAKLIAKLTAPKKEKKKEVKVEKVGPLVELSTEQLVKGHALYKKCIVCHGK